MNSNNSRTVPVQLIRKTSVDDFNERMIGMLDQVEKRVEQLRESAGQLEQERESLINMLGNVNLDSELLRLGQAAINKMKEDLNNAKEAMKRFLNACSPDLPDGPIDQRFQTQVIECTADDQKKIRRRLAILINQIERAQRYGAAEF
ncbi:hypothetical protein WUBG_04017 [Wuchereria bancrofti]|uniref:BAG domain-containing protein n=1 Tax=Wuchereria bancrofti TaxID=6293 RepID=J9F6F4_WUCBA|nr:hypothetical protein WUBG_04017 [Wuchereria bancrofti]